MKEPTNSNNKHLEQMMNSFYGYLGQNHVANIIESLEKNKDKIDEIEVSEDLQSWFDNVLKEHEYQEKRKRRWNRIRKISTRAALIGFILLASSIIVTVSVEAYRVKLLNMFIDVKEKYTSFEIKEESAAVTTIPHNWDNYYPSYLPKGYTLLKMESIGGMEIINFINSTGENIKLIQASLGANFQIDTENSKTTEVEINGFIGVLIEKDNQNNQNSMFWHNDEATFYILSNIDPAELIKIAKSVEKK